jgi:SAM-dependent methyltransferase
VDAPFSYDQVAYETRAVPQAHPDRLFVVGSLFGLSPCPPDRCRYLEVGCGDGTHLMAAALTLPDARFVGLDLSRAAIERGRAVAAELGLTNVALHHADLMTWEPEPGSLDYVAAHGLYSWVPAPVRDRLLDLYRQSLAPDGIGYVSYNTFPGGHFRRLLWDMLKFHTRGATEPGKTIADAREFLDFFVKGVGDTGDILAAAAVAEAKAAADPDDTHMLYHDDLAEVNDPVYFHQFVDHARAFGLKFVAESDVSSMRTAGYPPPVAGILGGMRRHDPVLKEQYLDFLKLRRFRYTLLCHDRHAPTAEPLPAVVTGLSASVIGRAADEEVNLAPGVAMTFEAAAGLRAKVDRPLPKAILAVVFERSPERIPFDELARTAAELVAPNDPGSVPPREIASVVLDAYTIGLLDLHRYRPAVTFTPGERPTANPLARVQARHGPSVTTLHHMTLHLEGDDNRMLVQLMDGTRDRAALAAELAKVVPPGEVEGVIEQSLAGLARTGLFVG